MQTDPASVLIVDDQPLVRRLIAKELLEHGFDCQTATDGPTAVERLRRHPFKLLVADIALPGVSGLELLAHAGEHVPGRKVILLNSLRRGDGRRRREQQ